MMMGFPNSLFARTDSPSVPPDPGGPIDPATLFGVADQGGYWDFLDSSSFAINADGTGGVPALDGTLKWVNDKGPRGRHLRNASGGAPIRRAGGVEITGGSNYGLYCLNLGGSPQFGDWVNISEPFEMIIRFEILAHTGNYNRILQAHGAIGACLGDAAGKVMWFSQTDGAMVSKGLNTDIVGLFRGIAGANKTNWDGGTSFVDETSGNLGIDGLYVASGTGGTPATALLLKRLLAISRALTPAERTGVVQWMQA